MKEQRVIINISLVLVTSWFVGSILTDELSIRYEAPEDCQWWLREPQSSDEVALICKLRTINSEIDTTNFSVIPSEYTTSLHIECSDTILAKSSLDERGFIHLTRLRELTLLNCKLGKWSAGALEGLRDLRNFTLKTRNTDLEPLSLEIDSGSLSPVKQLERLDLSQNNIWNFPENLFCPLAALSSLNVSHNRLQDIGDIGFRQRPQKDSVAPKCASDVQSLDASFNHFVLLPAHGFGTLRRLQELRLHNNEISVVADKALDGVKTLKIFDLSSNKVVALPSELFSDASSYIQEIYLQNNSISILAPGLFAGLKQLQALDLSINQLTSAWIDKNTFAGLIRLVLLNLSKNKISKLEPDFFTDLYTLQILNLRHNFLESIPENAFAPMNNLHTLLLSHNNLKYLDAYSLNGLYVLSLLALDNNALKDVHPQAFRNCSTLQDLNLNGNKLENVPIALTDMRLLQTVDLGENTIKNLEEPGFKGMSNLYGLRLISNIIENVSNTVFRELPSLQILNLARNKIRKVEIDAFETNLNLQAIRLDANQLTDIEGLFTDMPALLWLNISDNRLEHFDYSQVPKGLQWLDLHRNKLTELSNIHNLENSLSLQTLDASYNQLTTITIASLPNSIELLFLNDNAIKTVESHTFLWKTNLTRVDLYANQITSLDINALRIAPVPEDAKLPEFYIGGNPFKCDCTLEWLQRINQLNYLRQYPKVMDIDNIYCKLLYNKDRIYVLLLEAEPSDFICAYKTHCFALCHCCEFDACDCEMTCPDRCTCYHDQSWSANVVDCSGAGYAGMPSGIPMDATEVHLDGNDFGELSSHSFIGRKNLKILYVNDSNVVAVYNHTFSGLKRLAILHLEDNKIRKLVGFEFSTLESLRELFLQSNKLLYIDNRTFVELKNLEILRLENNHLTSFNAWQLTLNHQLVNIGLSKNPWTCDCKFLRRFRTYIQANVGRIKDADKISCAYNNFTKLLEAGNVTSCTASSGERTAILHNQGDDLFPLLLTTTCAVIGFIGILCGAFCYRRKLRSWICGFCGYNNAPFDEDGDKDRLFDAYISYSAQDEAFVNQLLVPGLEGSDYKYRLCLHHRDFEVSAYVADTILEAVESSHRAIVVLSKNFLHNEWCRFEYKSALREVLKERRRPMIIVLVGELPQRDLDSDLRLYLKTNTCIEWGDRHFWQKLRVAMPDARRSCPHGKAPVNIFAGSTPAPTHLQRSRSPGLPPSPQPDSKLPASYLHLPPSHEASPQNIHLQQSVWA